MKRVCTALFIMVLLMVTSGIAQDLILDNESRVQCALQHSDKGYSLGTIFLNGRAAEAPLESGLLLFRNTDNGSEQWFYASELQQPERGKAILSGNGTIDEVAVQFSVTLELAAEVKALRIVYEFNVDRDLDNWQACLLFHSNFAHNWKCHMYPWAADARYLQRDPLTWIGIPSLFMYRDTRSMGLLWGIDPNFDYLNPTTWTKDFGLYFIDASLPAQYRVGGEGLKSSIEYRCPMQILLTDKRNPDAMIIDLVDEWIALNDFEVDPLYVRSNDEALEMFIFGRKRTDMWYPGLGYRLEMGDPSSAFIYIGEQGLSALFDYMVYEMTGDAEWRRRAFEQMDFILTGQNNNKLDPNYGYVHTAFSLVDYGPAGKGFNSVDRGSNPGYKVDINVYLGRYMLHLWQLVKNHEGIDRRDWHRAAILAIDWALRQQNSDGGFPQKVAFTPLEKRAGNGWMGIGQEERVVFPGPGEKSISATSGRALPALWHIHKITGDERYRKVMEQLERYHLASFQNKFLFNSHHPDLPPHTLEEAGIWGICEYWLNRHDETGKTRYLRHAEANAHLSLTWKCPIQLSWVRNPTQLGSAEQQYFLQYSVYCYQNRQVECLIRLFEKTGKKLYHQLAERVMQNVYFTQVSEGNMMGATHERIADPWLARRDGGVRDFNSMGTMYMSEQSLDLLLQYVELYRRGRTIYFGEDLVNKVYPDGLCYYSRDIGDEKKVKLKVQPSNGYLLVEVSQWTKNEKIWNVSADNDETGMASFRIGGIEPGKWFNLMIDGKQSGRYQANTAGVILFSYTARYADTLTFKINE